MLTFLKTKNIFDLNVEALVNPVNCDGVMGAGLALQFKNRFLDNFIVYRKLCQESKFFIGEGNCFLLPSNLRYSHVKYILNIPTKLDWRDKSELVYVKKGLEAIVRYISKYDIKSIAIPALGCGLGGLKWDIIKQLIGFAFDVESLKDVSIYVCEPNN